MSLNFKEWEKDTSKYVIYCAFVALVFFATKSGYQDSQRISGLIKELAEHRKEFKDETKDLRREISVLQAEKDSLFKLNGYLNAINQTNLSKK